jgi:hypothetical protein
MHLAAGLISEHGSTAIKSTYFMIHQQNQGVGRPAARGVIPGSLSEAGAIAGAPSLARNGLYDCVLTLSSKLCYLAITITLEI